MTCLPEGMSSTRLFAKTITMKALFTNIKELLQTRPAEMRKVAGAEMRKLPSIQNAYLLVENGRISEFGEWKPGSAAASQLMQQHGNQEVIDCSGRTVLPAWCDSHTHLVYAGSRTGEFVDRINGLSYAQIAEKGGGILNSAKQLQQLPEAELYAQSAARLEAVMAMGTGAVEIKSGYGLTLEAELKMLRVARKLNDNYPVAIKTTFLGAHALPTKYKDTKSAYLDFLINEVLPAIHQDKLADFIDIFCETGYFSVADAIKIMEAGEVYGLPAKVHVNQFNAIGGVEAAVNHQALSVDHLEVLTPADLTALKRTAITMPVALPGCSLFLGIPYTPARKILDAGLPLALATDYNPGSAPSGNMNLVVSLACIKMNMTPEEAINAATLNGAYAMGLETEVGSITVGKRANLLITEPIGSYAEIPYSFGRNVIAEVWLKGKRC